MKQQAYAQTAGEEAEARVCVRVSFSMHVERVECMHACIRART